MCVCLLVLFQALEHLKPSDNCSVGKAPENREKNRYRDILPCKLETMSWPHARFLPAESKKISYLFKLLFCLDLCFLPGESFFSPVYWRANTSKRSAYTGVWDSHQWVCLLAGLRFLNSNGTGSLKLLDGGVFIWSNRNNVCLTNCFPFQYQSPTAAGVIAILLPAKVIAITRSYLCDLYFQ